MSFFNKKKKAGDLPAKNPFSFQLNLSKFEKASEGAKAQQVVERESVTFFKDGMRRLWKNKVAVTCAFVLIFIILSIVFVPMFYPYSYDQALGFAPGKSPDPSYLNLKPFEYGSTEKIRMLGKADVQEVIFQAPVTSSRESDKAKIEAAKQNAYKLLDAYNASEKTAESFAALSEQYGSSYKAYPEATSKEIPDYTPVFSWVWEYNFFTGGARQNGDTAVIEANDGYHVLHLNSYVGDKEKIFPHFFGTDMDGFDYFIRVIYGTRVSLGVGLFASIIVLIIGTLYGSISGYFGGKVDLIMMRIVDIIYSLPDMLMIILFSVVLKQILVPEPGSILDKLGSGMISIFIVFALLYWVSMARLIRGQILTIKQQEYVLTAKALGASPARIIRKHLIPNCISVMVISTALQIPNAIFTESFLSYLGLGVEMPMPSLGSLAADAKEAINFYPYLMIFPAVTICLIVLSLNLLGDGLRDAFDPKQKK